MGKQGKKQVGFILRALISIGSFTFLIYTLRDQLPTVKTTLLGARPMLVSVALILSVLLIALSAMRLKWVMTVQSLHLPFKDLAYLNLVGYFFNNFLPTAIGGDLVRAHYVGKRTGKKLESVSSIIVDRLFGFSTLITITLIALCFFRGQSAGKAIWWLVGGLLILFIVMLLFFGSRKIARRLGTIAGPLIKLPFSDKLKRFYNTVHLYRDHKTKIFIALIWALAGHLVIFLINYVYALSLSADISFSSILVVIPLTCFASMIPSINGLGVRESAYVFFFTGMIQPDMALALSLMWLVTLLFLGIAGGVVYALGAGIQIPKIESFESAQSV